jgi:hypothetical protein
MTDEATTTRTGPMNATRTLSYDDTEAISALLTGRRIVAAEIGCFARPDRDWGDAAPGRLTLDDGTVVLVAPNQGGCSRGAGDYDITSLAACDNVITAVRLVTESGDDYQSAESYRIYVLADAAEINAVQIDGDDGNGYYGTGFELIVVLP